MFLEGFNEVYCFSHVLPILLSLSVEVIPDDCPASLSKAFHLPAAHGRGTAQLPRREPRLRRWGGKVQGGTMFATRSKGHRY